jgi:hypothetical protein
VHAMVGEEAQAIYELFSGYIEVLVNVFQSLGCNRLNSNERTLIFPYSWPREMRGLPQLPW